MIGRNIGALLEREAIDAIGGIEHTILQNAVNGEIRLHLVVGDIELGFLHLGRIIEAIVGLELEIGALRLLCESLNGLGLEIGLRRISGDERLQESVDILGGLGHGALQRIRGIVGIAHDLGLLSTQLGYLTGQGEGVVLLLCTIGTMDGGLVDTLAEFAIVETGQDGLLGGIDDDDGIGGLSATAVSILTALGQIGLTETGEVFLLIDPHHSIVSGGRQIVAPLLLKVGDAEVDLLHTLHLIVGQKGTVANEALIGFLEQFLILALKRLVLAFVDLTNSFEEILIK